MPLAPLNHRDKVHKATLLRGKSRKVLTAEPVSVADLTPAPDMEALVKFAQPAIEISLPDNQSPAPEPTPKASSKKLSFKKPSLSKTFVKYSSENSPRKSLRQISRNLKTKNLRRSAIKAAKNTATPDTSKTPPIRNRSPKPLGPEELVAGVKIRIHEPRVAKIASRPQVPETKVSVAHPKRRIARLSAQTAKLQGSIKPHHRFLRPPTRADLINAESRLGSTIFGPIPSGHRREFFHDQQNIWIWHEAWTDESNHSRQMTVRYEVRPSGVYKKLSAGKYVRLEGGELENFRRATHVYLYMIKQKLYNRV